MIIFFFIFVFPLSSVKKTALRQFINISLCRHIPLRGKYYLVVGNLFPYCRSLRGKTKIPALFSGINLPDAAIPPQPHRSIKHFPCRYFHRQPAVAGARKRIPIKNRFATADHELFPGAEISGKPALHFHEWTGKVKTSCQTGESDYI